MEVPYHHPAWIEINLSQLHTNVGLIKKHIGNTKLCFPVKANAYGHGLVPVAKAAQNCGVDYLAVSCLQEGIQLRQALITIPILVLGAIHEDQIDDLILYDLEFTISSLYKARLVHEKQKRLGKICKIHLEIETGMSRTGVRCENALPVVDFLLEKGGFHIMGIYSHLACSDDAIHLENQKQHGIFTRFVQAMRTHIPYPFLAHLANSGAVCYFPEFLFDMVRPGLMLLGYFPPQKTGPFAQIAPFFSLKAKISYFKVVEKDAGISYGHTYIAKEKTRIITIPVGYGDGYRRTLSNTGHILLRGKRYGIVGTVCMDQFMVDIHGDEAFVGEEVVLIGKQGFAEITAEEIAAQCQTNVYDILCAFHDRLPRVYVQA